MCNEGKVAYVGLIESSMRVMAPRKVLCVGKTSPCTLSPDLAFLTTISSFLPTVCTITIIV